MRRAADAAVAAAEGGAATAAAAAAGGAPPLSAQEWAAVAREAFPAGDGAGAGFGWGKGSTEAGLGAVRRRAPLQAGARQRPARGWLSLPSSVPSPNSPPFPGNDYHHLRLADFSDAVAALPREELAAAMEGGGGLGGVQVRARLSGLAHSIERRHCRKLQCWPRPRPCPKRGATLAPPSTPPPPNPLPPPQDVMDEAVLAQIQAAMDEARRQGGGAAPGQQRVSEEELRGANPLVMLLRSLLPWVDAGQAPDYGADEGGGRGRGGGGGGGGGDGEGGEGGGGGQQQQ
jgi:hypothetical protein